MKQDRQTRLAVALAALLVPFIAASATNYPAWWSSQSVLKSNAVANDYAPVAAGQFKWIATRAYAELQTNLFGGAGTGVAGLVSGFAASNNYVPINLGQLKFVAKPFYERLKAIHYTNSFPWTTNTTSDDADFAPANIGQLKNVFSFDVASDTDGDDLPDWWENHWFGGLTNWGGADDLDGDELANSNEYAWLTCPTNADTDGDGASDGEEVAAGTNPLNNPGDTDGDGLSDDLEEVLGTDPDVADTDQDWAGDGYERILDFDPLNVSNTPPFFLEIDSRAPLTRTTNVLVSFPGLVGGNALIGETTDLVDGVLFDLTTNIAYGLQSELNGSRTIYARLYRNTVEQSPLISGSIIFDNIAPTIGNLSPANGSTTNSRWIKITGSVTDAVSTVRAFVNGEWSDGVSRGQFQYDRYMLDAGTNRIEITAEDMAGNIATEYLAVVQDTAGDTNAPTVSLDLPSDYIINGSVTNWLSQTTFGSNDTLYLKGTTDDETADVRFMVTAEGGTNGPFGAVVVGTQVWGEVVLFPGTNSLEILASDAAGNASTRGYTVVRDTNFFFEITNPAPYQVMNCPSTVVRGIASPEFLSATITVNGEPAQITNQGSIVTFSTVSPVPLNLGRTELTATAELNGRSYYADPVAYGYDVLEWRQTVSQTWDMQYWWATAGYVNNVGWQYEEEIWNATNRTRLLTNAWSNLAYEYDLRMPWRNGCFPTSGHAQEQRYRASYYEFVPKFPYTNSSYAAYGSALNKNMLFSELGGKSYSDVSHWIEDGWGNGWWHTLSCWDNYTVDISNEVRFVKRWPKQETQLVIFQFKNLQPNNPSAVTYRGRQGFSFNGDVAFIVPIKTETEYIINKSDFTWPSSFGIWSQTHVLSMDVTITNTVVSAEIIKPTGDAGELAGTNVTAGSFLDNTNSPGVPPFRYDWQGVPDSVSNWYRLGFEGDIDPDGFGYNWTLTTACGAFTNSSSPLPGHIPPSSISGNSVTGTLALEIMCGSTAIGYTNSKQIVIYRDHLQRDMENFVERNMTSNNSQHGVMRGGANELDFNCHDSTTHAYKGEKGRTDFWSGWNNPVTVTNDSPGYATPNFGFLVRGDVVAYYHGTNQTPSHSQTCTGNGNESWGANNTPLAWDPDHIPVPAYTNASFQFTASTAGDYFKNASPGDGTFPVVIKLFKKP